MNDLAECLAQAHRTRIRIRQMRDAWMALSASDALAVQGEVLNALGAEVGGWKTGPMESGHALFGCLFQHGLHTASGELAISFDALVGVEPEVAFVLAADLPAQGRPYDRDAVARCVARTMPVFDVAQSRFDQYASQPWPLKIADNLASGHLICGTGVAGIPPWLETTRASIRVNGRVVHQDIGSKPGLQPIEGLIALANSAHLSAGLRKGQVITTGSWTAPLRIEPGDVVRVEFTGFLPLQTRFIDSGIDMRVAR